MFYGLFQSVTALLMVGSGLVAILSLAVWLPLAAAIRVHFLWGIGVFFVPFVNVIFCILHWPEARRPILASLAGLAGAFVMFFIRSVEFTVNG